MELHSVLVASGEGASTSVKTWDSKTGTDAVPAWLWSQERPLVTCVISSRLVADC